MSRFYYPFEFSVHASILCPATAERIRHATILCPGATGGSGEKAAGRGSSAEALLPPETRVTSLVRAASLSTLAMSGCGVWLIYVFVSM